MNTVIQCLRRVGLLVVLCAAPVTATAQGGLGGRAIAPATPSGPSALPSLELSGDLRLEADIARLKIERAQLQHDVRALRAQLLAVNEAFSQLLAADAKDAQADLAAELKPVLDRLVRALGGDPEKGDTYNLQTGALVKAAAR